MLLSDPYIGTFNTLECFVDRVSEVLQCPVTLEDAHHHLLAYSSHNNIDMDSARIETIIRRRVPEKVINRLWKNGVIPKLLSTREPLLINECADIGLGPRAAVSIWNGDEVLGYIWVLEVNKRLNNHSLKQLKKAAAVARRLLLQYQRKKKNMNDDTQELFWQLLTGHHFEDGLNLKTSLPFNFTVAVFRFNDYVSEALEQKATYFFKTSDNVIVPLYTIDSQDIIVLIGTNTQINESELSEAKLLDVYKQFLKRFQKNLSDHVGIHQINMGFGGIYNDYRSVAKSYQEAKVVLNVHDKFAAETKEIFGYQELGIYQFLDLLLNERSKKGMENIALKKLIDYDMKNNTQLIETLYAYLETNENLNQAANRLHIHVNTLSYRLKRIHEIAGIDLTKLNQKMMLYLDLKLLKWNNYMKMRA